MRKGYARCSECGGMNTVSEADFDAAMPPTLLERTCPDCGHECVWDRDDVHWFKLPKPGEPVDKRAVGLLPNHYRVERSDGRDKPGGDRADSRYFVLDYVHSPHAIPALMAYAESCRAEYPLLAADLDAIVAQHAPKWERFRPKPDPLGDDTFRYTVTSVTERPVPTVGLAAPFTAEPLTLTHWPGEGKPAEGPVHPDAARLAAKAMEPGAGAKVDVGVDLSVLATHAMPTLGEGFAWDIQDDPWSLETPVRKLALLTYKGKPVHRVPVEVEDRASQARLMSAHGAYPAPEVHVHRAPPSPAGMPPGCIVIEDEPPVRDDMPVGLSPEHRAFLDDDPTGEAVKATTDDTGKVIGGPAIFPDDPTVPDTVELPDLPAGYVWSLPDKRGEVCILHRGEVLDGTRVRADDPEGIARAAERAQTSDRDEGDNR